MKKKIDLFWYWFIFVVAFVLCFFVVNDKKVNAYHLDNDGNLVSDNFIVFDNLSSKSINGITYSISDGVIYLNGTNNLDSGFAILIPLKNSIDLTNMTYYRIFNSNTASLEVNLSIGGGNNTLLLSCNEINPYIDINSNVIVSYLRLWVSANSILDLFVKPMLVTNDILPNSFEPYGIWYSESNLNTEKEISYEEGYNAGIVANNTAPSFYFDDITSLMQFRVLGNTSYVYVDNMSNVTGYNSIINFSELLGVQYGSSYFSQYYWTTLSLLNTINVSDTLVFNFSDISNAPDFSTKTAITFSSSSSCYEISNGGTICPNYATFTYDELLQNNFILKLEDFGELENVSEIDTISIQLYYNGTRSFGLLTLEDETLTGDITSDYEIGYRVGFITGEESGVVKGETIGYDKGYNEGYRKASQVVKDPGNNTLVGVVSVLMGMPVNMLVSIYDFEFLGVNLAEFFFSLITLLVSIWLIKKLL